METKIPYNSTDFSVGKAEGVSECIDIIDIKISEIENTTLSLRGMTELMYLSKINDLLVVAEERQKRIEGLVGDKKVSLENTDKVIENLRDSISSLKRSLSACIESISILKTELDEKNIEIERMESVIETDRETINFQHNRVKEQYEIIEKLKEGGIVKILKREILSVLKEGEDTEDYVKGYKDCYGNVISILDEF
jgi:chromosome segregation ATPase